MQKATGFPTGGFCTNHPTIESDGLTRDGDPTRLCHKLSTFCYCHDAAPDPSETVGERRVVPVPSPLGLPAQLWRSHETQG
jgi:hypothetical protein